MTLRTRSNGTAARMAAYSTTALLAAVGALACSSNTAPPAAAYVNAFVGPGLDAPNSICNYGSQQQWFALIGGGDGGPATTTSDGDSEKGTPVTVSCSVKSDGAGFDVNASASIQGTTGGTLTIGGTVTSSGGTGLTGAFVSGKNGRFGQNGGCTVTFSFSEGDMDPTVMAPVAGGHIWGHISCPQVTSSSMTVDNPDGGAALSRTCDGEADFFFNNCSQ